LSVIEKFLSKAKGPWLRADNCKVGDKLKIISEPTIDEQTFGRPYLICDVVLERTGEQFKLRMGPKNVTRIAETLGKDEKDWVGAELEVISIEDYSNLGRKGLLLRGIPKVEQKKLGKEPLSPQAVDIIRKSEDIIQMGVALSDSDWNMVPAPVRAELMKHGIVEKRGDYWLFTEKAKQYL